MRHIRITVTLANRNFTGKSLEDIAKMGKAVNAAIFLFGTEVNPKTFKITPSGKIEEIRSSAAQALLASVIEQYHFDIEDGFNLANLLRFYRLYELRGTVTVRNVEGLRISIYKSQPNYPSDRISFDHGFGVYLDSARPLLGK